MSKIAAREYKLKTGEKVVIRTAVLDDAPAILEHARIILAEDLYNVSMLDEFQKTIVEEKQWIQEHINHPCQIILVAELGGSIVGMLGFENGSRKRLAHQGAMHMSVRPEFRRKGIGIALLQSLVDWAEENPVIEKVTLAVFATNRPAIDLYKKMGFLEEGRRVRGIKIADGKYVDDILMYRFVKD